VTNTVVAPLHLSRTVAALEAKEGLTVHTLVLPDGEAEKTLEVLTLIHDKALENALDRQTTFVALGGGVIGDMVGFAAAIYQRGVDFIQVPTTVMAMVDSSVGGKTGVNHPLGKNMVGAFHQPNCVFVDTSTLDTLPDRELRSGLSEIIKYGLIRDPAFFEWQEQNLPKLLLRDAGTFAEAIQRSCENKADVVAADEKEAGVRATLNLGHTFGHAIENGALPGLLPSPPYPTPLTPPPLPHPTPPHPHRQRAGSGYGKFLHGEAVAIGTAMAASMSRRLGWIDEAVLQRTYDALHLAGLPTELPLDSPMTREKFEKLMSVDKKVSNGVLRLILQKGPLGTCVFTGDFDRQAMIDTIDDFCSELG
jgi:3-dehydroquinate synthase